jgi:mono/diheme cytochrome c family protein
MPRLAALLAICLSSPALAAGPDFAREVYPVLQRHCFECHGPKKQEGDLRLDERAAFLAGGASGPTVTAADPDESELLRRVLLPAGDDEHMPANGRTLTEAEVAALRRWIEAGAIWPEEFTAGAHWAYLPPVRPMPPEVSQSEWVRNPIDRFVLARLEAEGLKPSAEADGYTLCRRVHLDLTGLPPTPEEVEAFVNDPSPDAYEKLVDRLLASPAFGEKWARPWLDVARYADSHGFQRDDLRSLWPYRDWVIRALNANKPFDEFTIEQIAGDLLPDPTTDQLIATGFHRCTTTNVEAGTEPEETRVNQVLDRVNTTATVWLGTTLECAQCHDHKYDPFTQKDYYALFAFFNSTELEADRSNPKVPGSIRFLGPTMPLPGDPSMAERQETMDAAVAKIDRRIAALKKRGDG